MVNNDIEYGQCYREKFLDLVAHLIYVAYTIVIEFPTEVDLVGHSKKMAMTTTSLLV